MRIYCTKEQHAGGGPGEFFLSRAEEALPELLERFRGSVQVVYLDPPFGTGDVFYSKLGPHRKVPLSTYSDNMPQEAYLSWMRNILTGARELLCSSGSLYLHIDYRMSAKLRLMLDELFSE